MSSFFDDLEAQLRTAAHAHAGASAATAEARRGRHRLRQWLRAGRGAAPVLASILVAVAIAGGALLLVGPRGHGGAVGSPPPGGGIGSIIAHTPKRQLRRELGYVTAASQAVQ